MCVCFKTNLAHPGIMCVQEQRQQANGSLQGQDLSGREGREMHTRAQGQSRSAEPELSGAAQPPAPSQAAPASAAAPGRHRTAPAIGQISAAGISPASTPHVSEQHRSEDGAGAGPSAGLGALLQDLQKVQVLKAQMTSAAHLHCTPQLHNCCMLRGCCPSSCDCSYHWVCTAETMRDMHAHARHLP